MNTRLRRDGNQRLVIDEALIEEFAELEAVQFDHCPYYKDVWGLFGEQDTLISVFAITISLPFHIAVIPRAVKASILAQKMLMEFSAKEESSTLKEANPGSTFCLRLRDSGAHGGLSGSLWR